MKKKIIVTIMVLLLVVALLFTLAACGGSAVGIASIEKTGTDGNVDTYTITLTDGSTSTFTVINGKDGTNGINADGTSSDPNAPTPDKFFRFNLLEDGTYEIFARYLDMPSRVVIPSSYNDKPVTRIADAAFYVGDTYDDDFETRANISIDEIVLPDTIKSIGEAAFYDQYYLSSINIPDSVTEIGEYAFYGCEHLPTTEYTGARYFGSESHPYLMMLGVDDALTELSIHAQTKQISLPYSSSRRITKVDYEGTLADWVTIEGTSNVMGEDSTLYIQGEKVEGEIEIPAGVTKIAPYSFRNCADLTAVSIPASVTEIAYDAFSGCSGLTTVTFAQGSKLTSIDNYAFNYCTALTSITIPDSVTEIGSYAFYDCSALESISIPNSVTSIGRSAFEECTGLISIELGSGLTEIPREAFDHCLNVISVTIPTGVAGIDSYAFQKCNSMTSITLPATLTHIDSGALSSCQSLTSITFQGTREQWNAIRKASEWASYTSNYTIHCTDGDIEKE